MISRDVENLVPRIYEASTDALAWPDVLETIRGSASVSTTLLGILPTDRMWQGTMWGANLEPASVEACLQPGVIDRSVFARALTVMPCGALAELNHPGDTAVYDDPGAQALLSAQSLTEGIFGPITRDGCLITGLACLNEDRRGPLDGGAIRWIEALAPHFARSLAVSRRIERLNGEAASLRTALGHLTVGVICVTAGLTIRYSNAEAERILRSGDGISQRGKRLRLWDNDIAARLRAAVARLATRAGDAGPPCIFVPRPSRAPPYTLVVAPTTAAIPELARAGTATLFLTDPAGPTALPSPALLAAGLGLTASEAEVARLAAMGRGMAFVAESLGVSLNTARTHLKAVYAKIGINHQAALARTIADRFPPVRGLNGGSDAK
jgi:DNA-binding CsgD family transcriptional regulator